MNRCIHPQDLSNGQLLQRVEFLASRSKRDLAELLWHLAEVDARGLYRDQACSSMFTYCTDRLGFSESVAYKRITAARLARKFPAILRSVAKGEVTLSGVKSLAKVLTVENHERVLKAAIGKKTRDVEMLAAELAPKPDAPAQIRKLPTSASESTSEAPDASARAPSASGNLSSEMPLFAVVAAAAPPRSQSSHSDGSTRAARGSVAPLRADRFKVQFSASVELRNKLARAEELLGPMYGGGVARGDIR